MRFLGVRSGSSCAVFVASLLWVGIAPSASANVIYEYVGEPFTSGVEAPFITGDRVTGFMEFADLLGINLNLATVNPLDFSFTSGGGPSCGAWGIPI